jgi:voltage-gated potassium channel
VITPRWAGTPDESPWPRPRRRREDQYRFQRKRLLFPLSLVVGVILIGTGGYYWLWYADGGTWLDALFMTVTTITTIGYGEVRPLGTAGRLFTMVVAVVGIASLFYTFTVFMESLVTARLADPRGRRRMERRIGELQGHVIVAGIGRVGRQAVEEIRDAHIPVVVVDPSAAAARHAEERGWLLLNGDATDDGVLERAGVRQARGLVVTTANDATNMFIVLSARVLNPGLFIVSRAVDEASIAKLTRAGASRAISPYAIGGHRLAHLLLSPTVVDFFETALRRGHEALAIEGLAISRESPAVGQHLGKLDLRSAGASVLAVVRDGSPVVNPDDEFELRAGDEILALGTFAQLRRLEQILTGGRG